MEIVVVVAMRWLSCQIISPFGLAQTDVTYLILIDNIYTWECQQYTVNRNKFGKLKYGDIKIYPSNEKKLES